MDTSESSKARGGKYIDIGTKGSGLSVQMNSTMYAFVEQSLKLDLLTNTHSIPGDD